MGIEPSVLCARFRLDWAYLPPPGRVKWRRWQVCVGSSSASTPLLPPRPSAWSLGQKGIEGKSLLSVPCEMIPSGISSRRDADVFLAIPCGGTTPRSGPRLSCSPPGNRSSPACSGLPAVRRSRSTPSCEQGRGEERK